MTIGKGVLWGVAAMAVLVTASNILVQYPVGDFLTWGAFTYPFAFLATDLTNRRFGRSLGNHEPLISHGRSHGADARATQAPRWRAHGARTGRARGAHGARTGRADKAASPRHRLRGEGRRKGA